VSDQVPFEWWERLDEREDAAWQAATLWIATALVQDGMTGVTIVAPRAPGLVLRARAAAQDAGIVMHADQIASATVTLRFSGDPDQAQDGPARHPTPRGTAQPWVRWTRVLGWLRPRASGPAAAPR
jgi:hypothetical protein